MTGRQALNHAWLEPWMREVRASPRSGAHSPCRPVSFAYHPVA